ncbi:MAG: hypothetical protein ACREUZ_21800, partial [Burkholderiales bacterium]
FERNTVVACCPDEPLEDISVTSWGYDSRRHYTQPDWWRNSRYAPERLRDLAATAYGPVDPTAPVTRTSTAPQGDRELVTAREHRTAGDVSPHLGARAQPGDVLGIETGGEVTGIGDTAEDENSRREAAERTRRDR